jgi:excisionase family DNA binding protein
MMNHENDSESGVVQPGDYLTVEETARLLRLTPVAVKRLAKSEDLTEYRPGSRLLFNRHELALWLAARRTSKPAH